MTSARALCLDCRMVYAVVGSCDGGARHEVVDVTTPEGLERVSSATWGPPSLRAQLLEAMRAGAVGSGVGAVADSCNCGGAPDLFDGEHLIALLVVVAIFFALFMLGALLIEWVRVARVRNRLRPRGARVGAVGAGGTPRTGVAIGKPAPSPLRGEPCLAFGLELRTRAAAHPGNAILWHEAAAPRGFTIVLDDGEEIRVPAGQVRLRLHPMRARRAPCARAAAWLPEGLAGPRDELAAVPLDEAYEEVIAPGDRVEVFGPLERREDLSAPRDSLRAAARSVLIPRGAPELRRVSSSRS